MILPSAETSKIKEVTAPSIQPQLNYVLPPIMNPKSKNLFQNVSPNLKFFVPFFVWLDKVLKTSLLQKFWSSVFGLAKSDTVTSPLRRFGTVSPGAKLGDGLRHSLHASA